MISDKKIKVYMEMAYTIAKLSHDKDTQVGAILLNSKNKIIAASYNGFVQNAHDDILPKTRPHKYEYIQHAERNLIYNCAYEGIKTKNTTVICTLSPCLECVRACFRSGVKTIIFDKMYRKFKDIAFYQLADIHIFTSDVAGFHKLELISSN